MPVAFAALRSFRCVEWFLARVIFLMVFRPVNSIATRSNTLAPGGGFYCNQPDRTSNTQRPRAHPEGDVSSQSPPQRRLIDFNAVLRGPARNSYSPNSLQPKVQPINGLRIIRYTVEHCDFLHTEGVVGSNPAARTTPKTSLKATLPAKIRLNRRFSLLTKCYLSYKVGT